MPYREKKQFQLKRIRWKWLVGTLYTAVAGRSVARGAKWERSFIFEPAAGESVKAQIIEQVKQRYPELFKRATARKGVRT